MFGKTAKWVSVDHELPSQDGIYEVTSNPESRGWFCDIGAAYYDGYGFEFAGIYKNPTHWRKHMPMEKRYGKVQEPKETNELT